MFNSRHLLMTSFDISFNRANIEQIRENDRLLANNGRR